MMFYYTQEKMVRQLAFIVGIWEMASAWRGAEMSFVCIQKILPVNEKFLLKNYESYVTMIATFSEYFWNY